MSKLINLSGKKLKYCKIIDQNKDNKYSGSVWNCLCNCGKTFSTASRNIRNNKNINCGCIKRKSTLKFDLKGCKYENFTVLCNYTKKNNSIYWECKCVCGEIFFAKSTYIRNKTVISCGCIKRRKNGISSYDFNAKRKYEQYKIGAKKRNLLFNLSLKDFMVITQQNCYYCNDSPFSKTYS